MRKPLAVLLAALLAGPVFGQASSPPVKSSIEAVAAEIEVLVVDSKGKAVEGLTKAEFKLLVNGKETPIDWLEAPPATPASPAPAPAAAAAPAEPAAAAPAPPTRRAHSTVFVISDLHVDLRARNEGLKALGTYVDRLPAAEEAAVYVLDNGVRRLLGFTSDKKAVKSALAKPAKTLPRSYVFTDTNGNEWLGQSRQMLRNFTTVLDTIANRPEAKTVVVLAGTIMPTGFIAPIGGQAGSAALGKTAFTTGASPDSPVPQAEAVSVNGVTYAYSSRGIWSFLGEAKDAESQALLARATIVAFDPTGLYSPDGRAETNSVFGTRARPGDPRPANASTEGDAVDSFAYRSDTFALVAEATGGARLGFTNKPADALAAETDLLAKRYRLGFTPPDSTSARREIRVAVARPGVVVRTAQGQRSLTRDAATRARFAALLLSSDAPKGDFPIALETKVPLKDRKDDAFPFDVVVPVSGVYAEERGDTKRAKLELLIAAVDEEGRASDPMVIPFAVELDKAASSATGAFFRKDASFTLDHRWKGRLFVGVRDTATSRLGAVALPIGG
jgi:VWFA-related protein